MAKKDYSDKELNNMSIQELKKLDKELSPKTSTVSNRKVPQLQQTLHQQVMLIQPSLLILHQVPLALKFLSWLL